MVFSMNTIILSFQLLQSTSSMPLHKRKKGGTYSRRERGRLLDSRNVLDVFAASGVELWETRNKTTARIKALVAEVLPR